jgi:hypothetical protein
VGVPVRNHAATASQHHSNVSERGIVPVRKHADHAPACRNTIKALNWYSSVREKLDDPKYSSWFAKFKGFDDKTYPGGKGKETNGTFHVPTCDWYGTADKPPKCSGFYHVSVCLWCQSVVEADPESAALH